jgi:hypothetical protein
MKSVIVKENDKYNYCGIDQDVSEAIPQQVVNIEQTIIVCLKLKMVLLEKFWSIALIGKRNILKGEIVKNVKTKY